MYGTMTINITNINFRSHFNSFSFDKIPIHRITKIGSNDVNPINTLWGNQISNIAVAKVAPKMPATEMPETNALFHRLFGCFTEKIKTSRTPPAMIIRIE